MIIQRGTMSEIKNSMGVQLEKFLPMEDDWVGGFGLIKYRGKGTKIT